MSNENTKEIIVVTVNKDYYKEHLDIFKNENIKVRSVFIEGEKHEDDLTHKALLKKYVDAQKKLRDYEFEKRHNYNK